MTAANASEVPRQCPELPSSPARLFLVGIGGIGMSGLAQLLRQQGHEVAGSDRQLENGGREELYAKLRHQGIRLYAQDGIGLRTWGPDAVVVSAAVEATNPDLLAASGLPLLSRSRALADALNRFSGIQVAVAGSCGKTSVTAWLSSALRTLGQRIVMVDGGLVNEFETETFAGNFAYDAAPDFVVYEVDESDQSLVEFEPDLGILLNIGTDHYQRDELLRVFARFLGRCRESLVLPASLCNLFAASGPPRRTLFADSLQDTCVGAEATPQAYTATPAGIRFRTGRHGWVTTRQFGHHSAANAAAVLAAMELLLPDIPFQRHAAALSSFRGVRQRFERLGVTTSGVPLYNDYAHNVEKIGAAIQTAREAAKGPLLLILQPHGFKPLAFMEAPLKQLFSASLQPGDRVLLLPVFYAGGTTSFSPTSESVARDYASGGLPVCAVADRDTAAAAVSAATPDDTGLVLVLGGRDPSLRSWSLAMAACPR